MGLFDKKYCDICSEKIGFLGNKKLADGNMCKKCADKLSPFFSERKQSTIEEINEQLAYREANKEAVAAFHPTRIIGTWHKVYVDANGGTFAVSTNSDLISANPDIIDLDAVRSCRLDISENKTELKTKDKEGKSISYNPPRYKYSYDFWIYLAVEHPYFSEIKFKVNDKECSIESPEHMGRPMGRPNPVRAGVASAFGMGGGFSPRMATNYGMYESMGNDICEILLNSSKNKTPDTPVLSEAEERRMPAKCPGCGAPSENTKFCAYCGTRLI